MPTARHRPELSIVVPLFNEAPCLHQNISQVLTFLKSSDLSYEVLLVNDGSTDETEDICRRIVRHAPAVRLIGHAKNRGKGFAVRSGMLEARGAYRIFFDADLAVPVHYVYPLLEQLRSGASMVIGSRHLPKSSLKVREGVVRQSFGEVFRRLAKLCLGLKVSDITCGFKGFNGSAAFDIFSRSLIERWGYDAEVIFLAQKLNHTIREIPVEWYHSFDSKVKVGIDLIRTIRELFCIIRYYWMDRYALQGCKAMKHLDEPSGLSGEETDHFPMAPMTSEETLGLTERSGQSV